MWLTVCINDHFWNLMNCSFATVLNGILLSQILRLAHTTLKYYKEHDLIVLFCGTCMICVWHLSQRSQFDCFVFVLFCGTCICIFICGTFICMICVWHSSADPYCIHSHHYQVSLSCIINAFNVFTKRELGHNHSDNNNSWLFCQTIIPDYSVKQYWTTLILVNLLISLRKQENTWDWEGKYNSHCADFF